MRDGQTNGMRFPGVNVPPGATILDARIEFTAYQTRTGSTTLQFWGLSDPNPLTFPSDGTGGGPLSDLLPLPSPPPHPPGAPNATTATAVWSPPDWIDEQKYKTPSLLLNDIVQEIVNLPGWNPAAWTK